MIAAQHESSWPRPSQSAPGPGGPAQAPYSGSTRSGGSLRLIGFRVTRFRATSRDLNGLLFFILRQSKGVRDLLYTHVTSFGPAAAGRRRAGLRPLARPLKMKGRVA